MNTEKIKFTAKEKTILFQMILIGESVLGSLEEYRGKKGLKYQPLLNKVFNYLKTDVDTAKLIIKEHGELVPAGKVDTAALEALFEYDEYEFYEILASKLGKRDFIEQAPKSELAKLEKEGHFPFSLSQYITNYHQEFDRHDLAYIRAIPPDLQPQLFALAKQRKACFICGKTTKLIKTECCDKWICDDEDKYELFSYSDVSCHRNHRRMTLCGSHRSEGHPGKWQDCTKCRAMFDTEMYVYYGTNEYNHEILIDPPVYEPTKCSKCDKFISRGYDPYTSMPDGTYLCVDCDTNHVQHTQS